jgi:hypothetical protein
VAEERTVVTKLMQLAANRPNEPKTMMVTILKLDENDQTSIKANISKGNPILSIIPVTTTNKKGVDQDEQLKRGETVEQMTKATQEYQNRTQLSINEAYINLNLYREESEIKSANDEREINTLPKQHELKSSEESKMEEDNKSTAKFTNTETKNQKQDNKSTAKFTNTETKNQQREDTIRASYLLKDEKPQIQFNHAETKGSLHACIDESRQIQFNYTKTKGSQNACTDESRQQ